MDKDLIDSDVREQSEVGGLLEVGFPFPPPEDAFFTFVDLFAGIGGFRLAMQSRGGRCVFSSEIDRYACRTYAANYGVLPYGDIKRDDVKARIPGQFDILCAGFPCQPFSIAGVSKKRSLGRADGFRDKTQGTLFFEVADILSRHRPKAFILENVKNLVSHDKGRTFRVILEALSELRYFIHYQVLDASGYVPQHRERIFIVGFSMDFFPQDLPFVFPSSPVVRCQLSSILQDNVERKYTLSERLWGYLQDYAQKHNAKGNGFGYGLASPDGIARTLSARYYKDGSEILIPQHELHRPPRCLTPRECARLMGYPERFVLNAVSETQMYRQLGNSVVVPLVTAIVDNLVSVIYPAN